MPHPLRALIAAALGCVLLVAAPGGVGATGKPRDVGGANADRPHSFSRAEARQVLHHARTLLADKQSAPQSGPTDTRGESGDLTMTMRNLYLARPALTGADRRSADRLLSRSYAAARVDPTPGTPLCSTHFCVHYASPTKKSWAQTTLNVMEHVWSVEVPMMNRQPLPDNGTAGDTDNPNDKLDVYLSDLGSDGFYGYCQADGDGSERQVPAYCGLDDDFARSQFGAAPINSLRVTAAHEFFHAIQFAADVSEATWFMEGSATWAEDVVYDDINDNYQYLATSPIRHPRTPLNYGSGLYPYGSFIFFTFSSERHGNSVVRRYWDDAVGSRTGMSAIKAVLGPTHWASFFTLFASWNTLPAHSYSERAGYPSPGWWKRKTLKSAGAGTGLQKVSLGHLSSSAIQLFPGAHLSRSKHLLVTIDAPPASYGSRALFQRRYQDGRVTQTEVHLNSQGDKHLRVSFNHHLLKSVAIVVASTRTSGPAHTFKVRATVR
jgi:hypothetical protein